VIESGVDRLGFGQAHQEEPRRRDGHVRKGGLAGHDGLAERGAASDAAPRFLTSLLRGGDQIGARGLQSRGETEEGSRAERHEPGEGEHGDVEAEVEASFGKKRGAQPPQERLGPDRDQDSESTVHEREQHRFGQKLSGQAATARSQREAHRDLSSTGSAAPKKKTRDVGASDGEHERDRADEHGACPYVGARRSGMDSILFWSDEGGFL